MASQGWDPERLPDRYWYEICPSRECVGARRRFSLWLAGNTGQMAYYVAQCVRCGWSGTAVASRGEDTPEGNATMTCQWAA